MLLRNRFLLALFLVMAHPLVLSLLAAGAGEPPAEAKRVHERYEAAESKELEPLLSQVLRFATVKGNASAFAQQKAWLMRTAGQLGLVARDAGPVIEIELPGPPGAPVLGLVVHGDVQPVDEDAWSFPPFAGIIENGYAKGRGAADDKGPLVQALLAMRTLQQAAARLTHTIRLLVGSDEESDNKDVAAYLATHQPPDYSLVLDSMFPVVVGEKAWNALVLTTSMGEREERELGARPFTVEALDAGVSPSIVPDRAQIVLSWLGPAPGWQPFAERLRSVPLPEGIQLAVDLQGRDMVVTARGRAAHSGMNLEGGRNALVGLATAMQDYLPASGATDLLAFALQAGRDLYGTGLRLTQRDPLWGRCQVNVATIKPLPAEPAPPRGAARALPPAPRRPIIPSRSGNSRLVPDTASVQLALTINIRSIPPWTGEQLKQHLQRIVSDFNARRGSDLKFSGYFLDSPLSIDPKAKLVKRLLADYERATGQDARPAVSGGGTYAKRLPNSIAFGMWFPGKPYPGHDVDEAVAVSDLHRGVHVLLEALLDLASSPRIDKPLLP